MKLLQFSDLSNLRFSVVGRSGVPANGATYGILLVGETRLEELDYSSDLITDGSLQHGDRPCTHVRFLEREVLATPDCWKFNSQQSIVVGQSRTPDPIRHPAISIDSLTPNGSKNKVNFAGPVWLPQAACPAYSMTYPAVENSTYRVTVTLQAGPVSNTVAWYHQTYLQYNKKTGKTSERDYPYTEVERHANGYQYRTRTTGSWSSWRSLTSRLDLSLVQPTLRVRSLPKTWNDYTLFEGTLPKYNYDDKVYADLVRRSAEDARTVSSNMLENTREIAELAKTLRAIRDLSRGRVDIKKISSAYLMHKYGPRLTISDISSAIVDLDHRIRREAREINFSRSRETIHLTEDLLGRDINVDFEYNYKIYFNVYPQLLSQLVSILENSGFSPSLKNLWDLVPFSFMVDWMTKTSSHLESVDSNLYWRKHDIQGVTYSKKSFYRDVDLGQFYQGLNFGTPATYCSYRRYTGAQPHHAIFFESTPHKFNNYVELGALVVQLVR